MCVHEVMPQSWKGQVGFFILPFLFICLFVWPPVLHLFLKVNDKNSKYWRAWQWSLPSLVLFFLFHNNIDGQSFIGICPWACAAKWIRWRGSLSQPASQIRLKCQSARTQSNMPSLWFQTIEHFKGRGSSLRLSSQENDVGILFLEILK